MILKLFPFFIYNSGFDFETEENSLRDCNYNSWLDLNVLNRVDPTGVLQLVTQNIEISSLELSIDLPLIDTNYYGPFYYNYGGSVVTARALDSRGQPVSEEDISISVSNGYGYLDNTNEVVYESNSRGEVYSIFTAPFNNIGVEHLVDETGYDGLDTYMICDVSGEENIDDIYVYQILKHDPVLGTIGVTDTVFAGPTATTGLSGAAMM